MYIFLDFDGVLRPLHSAPGILDHDCLELFESVMRSMTAPKIVVTSTWRLAMSLAALRRLFSTDIATRIVGVTPDLFTQPTHHRYMEIQAYLKKCKHTGEAWVAIDDDAGLYPKDAPLIVVDPIKGFNAANAAELWMRIAKMGG
jgi:hypothetical protein